MTKDYNVRGRTVRALDGLDLRLSRGEFVCVVGASGSGKSTLLSMIAGLTRASGGEITLDGEPVTGSGARPRAGSPGRALYPWRTVERNIAFGLELLPLDDGERARRVDWYLAETGLSGLRRSLPRQLSGGQQQRVAIARALACEPEVLLLDEPLGALDVQTKEDMQVFIRQVWKDTGTTVLMVTHDVEEAVFLGQRVVVLASDPGRMIAEVAVELPTDRDLAIKRVPTFLSLRASIEDLIRWERRSATVPGEATA